MHIIGLLGAVALGSLSLVGCKGEVARLAATDGFTAAQVPQPPVHQQGDGIAFPVYFVDQAGIDQLCGGANQIIACAIVGGTAMAVPNPCQARFAGESYAAVLCHERGHNQGWKHEQ
jgi:hypothetical protein